MAMANASLVDDPAKAAKYGPLVAKVNSASEPDKYYEVRRMATGDFSCQCMGWRFNKDTPRHCRHTDATKNGTASVSPTSVPMGSRPSQTPVVQTPKAVTAEATACVVDIAAMAFPGMSMPPKNFQTKATARVEAAIRKFLTQIATPTAMVDVAPGVRLITLDD